jgi:hypothetical protein
MKRRRYQYKRRAPHPDGLRRFLESAPLGQCAWCEKLLARRGGFGGGKIPRFCLAQECRAAYFRLWWRDAKGARDVADVEG